MRIEWASGGALTRSCPACGVAGEQPFLASTELRGGDARRFVRCPECRSIAAEVLQPVDYAGTASLTDPAVRVYVEHLASLSTMVEPLLRLRGRTIRRYLEVGCAFGLSLDFARFAFGWTVRGVDPSALAALGREALDLDIVPAYLDGTVDLGPAYDVILGGEVIEHVADPQTFLRRVQVHLAPDGMLLLTTPNASAVHPGTPAAALIPILSVEHLVLFTAAALERLLRTVGFRHVVIKEQPTALHAFASRAPFVLGDAAAVDGALYRRYLAQRGSRFPRGSPLAVGFDSRLFKAAVCAADFTTAAAAFERLRESGLARFGLDLAAPEHIELPRLPCSFEAYAQQAPFDLTAVLFFSGITALHHRDTRAARAAFTAAIRASEVSRAALRTVGADDFEAEHLAAQACLELRRLDMSRWRREAGRVWDGVRRRLAWRTSP